MGLLTGRGRIGRCSYFLINLAIGSTWAVSVIVLVGRDRSTQALSFHPALVVISAVAGWLSVANVIRRLHDRGHSGLAWLLSLVPPVGFLLGLYLLFAPGDEFGNPYGPSPGRGEPKALRARREQLERLEASVHDVQRLANDSYLGENGR